MPKCHAASDSECLPAYTNIKHLSKSVDFVHSAMLAFDLGQIALGPRPDRSFGDGRSPAVNRRKNWRE